MTSRTYLGITYTDDGAKLHHRGGPGPKRELCIMACVFCRDPLFKEWIRKQSPIGTHINDEGAKAFILSLCQVASRNELDTDPAAAERFHRLIRSPFMAWKEAQS